MINKKLIDKFFFTLYNYYHKDGNYRNGYFTKFIPWHYTIFILSLGTILWLIFFASVAVFYIRNKFVNTLYVPFFILAYFIFFSFYYAYFIKNDRYQEIYDQFKDGVKLKKIKSIVAIFLVIVLPLILIVICSLFWHNLLWTEH
jgi:hypothetical protein